MKLEFDLYLIKKQIKSLLEAPYFNEAALPYIRSLQKYVTWLIDNSTRLNPENLKIIVVTIWANCHCLNEATSREIPYELVFCLELALKQWTEEPKSRFIIVPSIGGEKDFSFKKIANLHTLITQYTPKFSLDFPATTLISLSLPKAYKNTPLFCIPLYHELGHFINFFYKDLARKSVWYSRIRHRSPGSISHDEQIEQVNHYREFFADLFAACYMGDSMIGVLGTIAGGNGANKTHPATEARMELLGNFMAGRPDAAIEALNRTLAMQKLPEFQPNFYYASIADLSERFDDYRPVDIRNEKEVHGLFNDAWKYLNLKEASEENITIVNDLVEKSLRSFSIRKWWTTNGIAG